MPLVASAGQKNKHLRPLFPPRDPPAGTRTIHDAACRPEPPAAASAALGNLDTAAADSHVFPSAAAAPAMATQRGRGRRSPPAGGILDAALDPDMDWRSYDADWAAVRPRAPGAIGFGDPDGAAGAGGGRVGSHRAHGVHDDLDAGCYTGRCVLLMIT